MHCTKLAYNVHRSRQYIELHVGICYDLECSPASIYLLIVKNPGLHDNAKICYYNIISKYCFFSLFFMSIEHTCTLTRTRTAGAFSPFYNLTSNVLPHRFCNGVQIQIPSYLWKSCSGKYMDVEHGSHIWNVHYRIMLTSTLIITAHNTRGKQSSKHLLLN